MLTIPGGKVDGDYIDKFSRETLLVKPLAKNKFQYGPYFITITN